LRYIGNDSVTNAQKDLIYLNSGTAQLLDNAMQGVISGHNNVFYTVIMLIIVSVLQN